MTTLRGRSLLIAKALRFDGSLPTTAAGVEAGLVTVFLGVRCVVLVQLAVAVPSSLARAPRPLLSVVLATLVMTWAAYFAVHILRRGSLRSPLVYGDVSVACGLLVAQTLTLKDGAAFLTWDGWGFGATLNTAALAALALRTRTGVVTTATLLAACYLTPILVLPFSADQVASALINALAYFAFSFAARISAGYLRRLGSASDAARAEAARLAKEAQIERTRALLHDQSSVLTMLSRQGSNPSFLEILRHAASRQAARVHSFMADQDRFGGSAGTLGEALRAVVQDFPDLPLTCSVDLARDVRLAPDTLAAVCAAVGTVLDNVRRHSSATSCVIHADSPSASTWEIVVSDDGVGFDMERTLPGYGLSRLVRRAMESVGASVDIASSPGEGTVVTLTGKII